MSRSATQLIPRREIDPDAIREAIMRAGANAEAMRAGGSRPRAEQVPWTLTGVGIPFRLDDGELRLALIVVREDRQPLTYASQITVRAAAGRARQRALDAMGRQAPAFAPVNLGPILGVMPGHDGLQPLGFLFDAGPVLSAPGEQAEYVAWLAEQRRADALEAGLETPVVSGDTPSFD